MYKYVEWILDLFTAFFNYLWKISTKFSRSRIRRIARKDSHAAVKERERLIRRRRIIKTLYFFIEAIIALAAGLLFVVWAGYFLFYDRYPGQELSIWVIAYVLFLLIIPGISFITLSIKSFKAIVEERIGNISTLETLGVISLSVPYALYLRAFKVDNRKSAFSERQLAQTLLQQDIVMCAVGEPEEVDAPPGAIRVYINNDTWQEEVRLLLEFASCVFLRICNTEPCIWEVRQALDFPRQLFVIIDDMEEYEKVYAQCPGLPDIISFQLDKYAIYMRQDGDIWVNVKLEEPKQQPQKDPLEDPLWQDFNKDFVPVLLERFPLLCDASAEQYKDSIKGIYSNMPLGLNDELKTQIATRMMDLLEAYYSKGKDEDKRMKLFMQQYLQRYEWFDPLSDELQFRRDELQKKVDLLDIPDTLP